MRYAALDDHVELTQRAQILKRVAGADDQVGLLVRLNAAGQITDAREPGIEFRRAVERERGRHAAVFDEIVQLAPHVVM